MPAIEYLPTSDPAIQAQRPKRLTKEAIALAMEDVATCANVEPLRLPREIVTAYMAGVPITALARWFGVSHVNMANYINVQMAGYKKVERIMRAAVMRRRAEKVPVIESPATPKAIEG